MALAGIAGAITYAIGSLIAFSGLLINMKTGGSRSWWMLAGAVLCGLFAGLCFAGYKKIEK